MTKPAKRTITYAVYPPSYKHGDGYHTATSLKEAISICRKPKFGPGSEIVRWCDLSNRKGNSQYYTMYRNFGKQGIRYDEFVYQPVGSKK